MSDGTMHIVATGLNHQTAPVELRERIAFSAARLPDALAKLCDRETICEAAILSTCNRAELYAATPEPAAAVADLVRFISEYHQVGVEQVETHLYRHTDDTAARHLFRVASGIDSMVLGEGEILSQVKQAHQHAAEAGTSRTFLNELFQRGLHIGKRARTETGIHRGAVSVSSVAVELACDVFGDLRGREVLVVGAGEMSAQTLKHLVAHGVATVVVANRTYERAAELAAANGGLAIRFDDFPQRLQSADIIVSASAAPHPILTVEKLRPHLAARRGRPLFVIDIAVPRDVEPEVAQLPNVYLFDVDDLQEVSDRSRHEREREVARVEALIEDETARFMSWLRSRGATPLVTALRSHAEALRDQETERYLRRLAHLSAEDQETVRQMMRALTNKLLHAPLTNIKRIAAGRGGQEELDLIRQLFDLDDDDRGEQP